MDSGRPCTEAGGTRPPGARAIYTAASRSLAVLEILVDYAIPPADFVMTTVRLPNRVEIEELPRSALAPGWRDTQTTTRTLSQTWLTRTCVLFSIAIQPANSQERLLSKARLGARSSALRALPVSRLPSRR